MKKIALRIACSVVALATLASTAVAAPFSSLSGGYVGPTGFDSGGTIPLTNGGIDSANPPVTVFPSGAVTVSDMNINLAGFTNPSGTVAVSGPGGFVISDVAGSAAYSYLNVVPANLLVTTATTGILQVIIGANGANTTNLDLFQFYRLTLTYNGIQVINNQYVVPPNGTSSASFTLNAVGGPDGGPLDPVPEPASIAIWVLLILAVGGWIWRQKVVLGKKGVCVSA